MDRRSGDHAGWLGPRGRRAHRDGLESRNRARPRSALAISSLTARSDAVVREMHQKARAGDPGALEVVARWAELGDEATWSWLLHECELIAHAVVRRVTGRRNAELAQELAQQTVLELHTAIMSGQFDPRRLARVQNFLRVVSTRLLAKLTLRRARERATSRRRITLGILASDPPPPPSETDDATSIRGLDVNPDQLRQTIARLPEPDRTAVVLHARGLSLSQIAIELGFRSKSGTRRALMRGLARVRATSKSPDDRGTDHDRPET
jgi:RNA polymerase sigma factor (sigma-70 family)